MDLKQKYIEETKPYELDEEFLDQLREIPITHSVPIAVLKFVFRFDLFGIPDKSDLKYALGPSIPFL